ncbi:MAG: DNA polymerase IV, partial [Deltaproteobacteria bacterium]|nr:DNA polymerase IV [Deltaproteobacteria bacterium]
REATNTDGTILSTVWELYRESGFTGRPVRLIGLGISEWGDSEPMGDLFDDPEERVKEERLYATMDEVTEKFGKGKLSLGLKKRD